MVINSAKAQMTGAKNSGKEYQHYTGYPGGIREARAEELRAKHPERLIEAAVRGMLPKNRVGRAQFRKLKVYVGAAHPHQAQQPSPLELKTRVP